MPKATNPQIPRKPLTQWYRRSSSNRGDATMVVDIQAAARHPQTDTQCRTKRVLKLKAENPLDHILLDAKRCSKRKHRATDFSDADFPISPSLKRLRMDARNATEISPCVSGYREIHPIIDADAEDLPVADSETEISILPLKFLTDRMTSTAKEEEELIDKLITLLDNLTISSHPSTKMSQAPMEDHPASAKCGIKWEINPPRRGLSLSRASILYMEDHIAELTQEMISESSTPSLSSLEDLSPGLSQRREMLKFIRLRLQQADVPLQIVSTGKIGANWLRNIVFRQPIFRFANVYNGEQDQGGGFSILPIAAVESRSNTTALSSDVIPSAPLLESRVPASTVASPSVPWNNHVPSFMRIREPIKENGKISASRSFIKEARRARREGATKHKTGILPGDKDKDKVRISKSRRAIPYTSVSTRHQRDKSIRGVCVSDAKPWLGDQIKAMFSKWSKQLSDKNTVGQGVVPKKGPDDQQVEDELSDYEDDKSSDQAHRDEIVKPRRNEGPEKYSCSIHYSNRVCDDLLQGFRMLMTSAA